MTRINLLKNMYTQLIYILNKKQKCQLAFLLVFIIFSAFLETLGVSAILPLIQAMLTPEELLQSPIIQYCISVFHINGVNQMLMMICTGVIAIYIIKNIILLILAYVQNRVKLGIKRDLSVLMLSSYLKHPYTFFLDVNSAEMMRGLNSDVFGVYGILESILKLITELLVVFLIACYLLYTDWIMALSIGFLGCICILIIHMLLHKNIKTIGQENREAAAYTNQYAYEAMGGIKEILSLHREDMFVQKYRHACEKSTAAEFRYTFTGACPERIIEAVCISGMISMIGFRITMGMSIGAFIPKLAVLAVAVFRILPSIARISGYINSLLYYASTLEASYRNIKEVYEFQEEFQKTHSVMKTEPIVSFTHKLTIKNITWQYDDSEKPTLINLSLDIHKGESIAFIGSSGAGKTTLADIILGLLVPQKGNIFLDETDICTIPVQWSKMIGYIPQNVFLLDDSIKNNIIFGMEPEVSDESVWKAIEYAQLRTFVESLPDGLNTYVGEKGVRLSGGQCQRIAIARALYNNPEILVMDEATSALDNETEQDVMEIIDSIGRQKTLIIIAHRLSTIKNCDRIIEITHGMAIERNKEDILQNI